MRSARQVEIRRQSRLFDDFFKIDEFVVSHRRKDGTMSPEQRRLVFERGDSVAVLLLHVETRCVVLARQFRLPAMIARQRDHPSTSDGWVLEAVAGMIDPGETPVQAVIREAEEETGYRIDNPWLIGTFFSSPGGTSERIFIYFAPVREADRSGEGGGDDDEDIALLKVPLDELFARLAHGGIEDPKLAISAHWLKEHVGEMG